MDDRSTAARDAAPHGTVHTETLAVPAALRPWVTALVGVELDGCGPTPLAIAPHDAMMLTVQFPQRDGRLAVQHALGSHTCLTGIRQWTGRFVGAGDCITLFALLTPLGAVQLLNSRPLADGARIRAPLSHLLDARFTRGLESSVAQAADLPARLQCFAAWLEQRSQAPGVQQRAALRAARAAMRLGTDPALSVDAVADQQHVSRRQIERDFGRWLGVSPRHWSQVARVQGAARRVHAGDSLAGAAATMGFADQSHLNRVVRQLTGLTPRGFVRTREAPVAAAFRAATGGGTVYL